MENTYWNNAGKYQADYDRLLELMPSMGKCDTVAGELIRAASRLGYDFYNNGMGNNTSGACNFLEQSGAIDRNTARVIHEYTRGLTYSGHYDGDALQRSIESMVDQTIEFIFASPELLTKPNLVDMFEFSEDDQNWCDECGDELDGHYHSVCRHCEDAYYDEAEAEDALYA